MHCSTYLQLYVADKLKFEPEISNHIYRITLLAKDQWPF